MIDTVVKLEPRNWFDVELKRTIVPWSDGMVVADLYADVDVEQMVFRRNGKLAAADTPLNPGDAITAVASPGGGGSLFKFIFVLFVQTIARVKRSKQVAPLELPEAISDESKPSQSFTFGGSRTLYTGPGVPLPVVYGERAVGGIVIGRSVFASGSPQPQQILTVTVALCSGQVTSIAGLTQDSDKLQGSALPSGILLNGNSLSAYEGVELAVRLGSPNQLPIPGAPLSSIESLIGLPLTNLHVDDPVFPLVPVVDWSLAVVHVMPEEGDGVLVTIGFPDGLFESIPGGTNSFSVSFEVRYRAVDDFGVPFGDYWPGGSSDPEQGIPFTVTRTITSDFAEGFFIDLFDPQDAGGTQPSEGILMDTVSSYYLPSGGFNKTYDERHGCYLDAMGDLTYKYAGQPVEEYSIEFWCKSAGYTHSDSSLDINENGVFSCGLLYVTDVYPNQSAPWPPDPSGYIRGVDKSNPDAIIGLPSVPQAASFLGLTIYAVPISDTERQVGFYWGDGIGVGNEATGGDGWVGGRSPASIFCADGPGLFHDVSLSDTFHVVFTYERDFDGLGNNRGQLFVNGTLQNTTVSTIEFIWPDNADLHQVDGVKRGPLTLNLANGEQQDNAPTPTTYDSKHYTSSGRIQMDRLVLYDTVLTESQAFFKYSAGLGQLPQPITENVEAWWEFDSDDAVMGPDPGEVRMVDRVGNHELTARIAVVNNTEVVGIGVPDLWDALDTNDTTTEGSWNGYTLFGVGGDYGLAAPSVFGGGGILRGRYEISIQRTTLEEDSDTIRDSARVDAITIFNSTQFSYPGVALISIRVPAQDQLTNLAPNLSVPVQGPAVNVWDGLSETNPTYSKVYTRNNAWHVLDMLTSEHIGLDKFHTVSRSPLIAKFQAWADNCDELVSDQSPPVAMSYLPGETLVVEYSAAGYGVAYGAPVSTPAMKVFLGSTLLGGDVPIPAAWQRGVDVSTVPFKWVEISGFSVADQANDWPADGTRMEVVAYSDAGSERVVILKWPDGLTAPTGPLPISTTVDAEDITFAGLEPRSQCDVVWDQENKSAWDAVLDVCAGGRAIPVRIGDRISVAFQAAREPVQMFSSANIIPGTLKLSSIAADDEYNSINYTFFNESKDWRRESITLDHPDLSNGTDTLRSSSSLSSSVITRPSQINREARYLLNYNKLVRQFCEFDTSIEAVALEAGDVFMLSGSLPAYGFAGRMPDAYAAGLVSIVLDVEVSLSATDSYQFAYTAQDGSIEEVAVLSSAGVYAAGDSIDIDALPASVLADAHWAIGTLDTTTRLFQVSSITVTDGLVVSIVGSEYLEAVYDETGFPDLPTDSGTLLYDPTQTADGIPPPLAALSVSEVAGPDRFGSSGEHGLSVSIQHARDSALLGTANQSGNASAVRVMARRVSSGEAPVLLGTIPPGSTSAIFKLSTTPWNPGDIIEVSAAAESPAGAAHGPLRSLKASLRLSTRSSMPNAPTGLTATLSGSSCLYGLGLPLTGERARPVRGEIRAGGWVLGQRVATLSPGETTRPTNAWFSLPTSTAGRSSPPLFARYEYANGQYSDVAKLDSFAPAAPGSVIAEDSFEDGPWDAVTGDSGTVALVELESIAQGNGESWINFTRGSAALTGTWTSPEYDTGRAREYAVFFAVEAAQVHPELYNSVEHTYRTVSDHSVEGPLSNFPDLPSAHQGQVQVTLEVAYSDTATPGTDWQEYRPGVYSARSFAFRITFTRPNKFFDVDVWRGAFRITEPAQVVTYAGSF